MRKGGSFSFDCALLMYLLVQGMWVCDMRVRNTFVQYKGFPYIGDAKFVRSNT